MEFPKVAADTHWWRANAFEVENEADVIDAWRERVLNRYEKMATDLEPERKEWLKGVPKALRNMMRRVHGPLIKAITQEMGFEDSTFNGCLQRGFPVLGKW